MKPTYGRNGRLGVAEIRQLLDELQLRQAGTPGTWSTDRSTIGRDDAHGLAVRRFQQERGLDAHGIVDADTYQELLGARFELGDRPLSLHRPFVRGDDVRELQQQLAELGFHHGNQDGIFGPTTSASLRAFQFDYGLTVDGVCGTITARALRNLLPRVTGGSASALVSQAFRQSTGPDLAGRYIVVDPSRPVDAHAQDFIEHVTDRVRDGLESLGANALLAQSSHEELSANERSTRANGVGAEIYLSLDVASNVSPHAEGVATYYFGSPTAESQVGHELAGLLQRELTARTPFTDLGEHPRIRETLRATRMPSVHLELGYLSNSGDRARMSDVQVREGIASAVVAGLQRFYMANADDHPTGTWQVPRYATD